MNPRKPFKRQGFAFLILVFMLLVIVMGCVQMMIRQEVSQQTSSRQKQRTQILKSAIEIGVQLDLKTGESVTLPISNDADANDSEQKVSLSFDESAGNWVATWLKDDREIDSLIQKKMK
ncbi:hypothetical protein LF1_12310 [Rubripirellula obstinata]|uniref:Uncharacterized protein n=1 Tax=Rubripirellula obstinata TaxID=406547 RepID=A0A5B1CC07_9BACT|nr:hypothetical protein [Rubripirellula obstinata]KAA1258708.1 hypothetical protein LF1_12310 [Rubripirellula obstinata]